MEGNREDARKVENRKSVDKGATAEWGAVTSCGRCLAKRQHHHLERIGGKETFAPVWSPIARRMNTVCGQG